MVDPREAAFARAARSQSKAQNRQTARAAIEAQAQEAARDSWRAQTVRSQSQATTRAVNQTSSWQEARARRAAMVRNRAIQEEAERRRKIDEARRRQAATPGKSVDELLNPPVERSADLSGLLAPNEVDSPAMRRMPQGAMQELRGTGKLEDVEPVASVSDRMPAGAMEELRGIGEAPKEPEPNSGLNTEQSGALNKDKRLASALVDPVFKTYYDRLLEWKGKGQPADEAVGIPGVDGSLFANAPEDKAGAAFPSLAENAPPFLMARDASGEYKLYEAQDAFDEYLSDVDDPRKAGLLAFTLNAGGFYGFDSPASKRLKDRLIVREVNGKVHYELNWGDEDDEALESALKQTSRLQAEAAEDGTQTDFKNLIEKKAMQGLGLGEEASDAIESGAGSTPDLSSLKPGNYGGYDIDSDQAQNLAVIAEVGRAKGVSERDIGIAIIAAITESNIRSLPGGDRDSAGIFQQRPSRGWGSAAQVRDPNYAAGKFFDALKGIKNRDAMSMGEVAQAVQKSAYPERYAQHVAVAAAIVGGDTFRANSAPLEMLGKVKPHARAAAEEVSGAFGKKNIGGLAKDGHIEGSDHYTGQAIDVMLEGAADGAAIATYATLNAERWGVKYVIHNRKIWEPGKGWQPYDGDNPHTGHVHVSFNESGGTSGTVMTAGQAAERAMGGTGGTGGTSGTGSSGGTSAASGAVAYADPTEVERAADSVAIDRLGRELDEDEVADVLNLFHNAQREYQQNAGLGISAVSPDLMGMVEKYIDDKLNEEAEQQMEGEFAVTAFRLLAGESGLSGIGI